MSQLTVRNEISELERVNAWLTSLDEVQRLSERNIYNLLFVVEELFVNIVQYGFTDEQEHSIELTESSVRDQFQVTLSDDGIPFDPTAQPRPSRKLNLEQRRIGGEGINISREMIPQLSYARKDDENHVTIRIPFSR